MTEFVLNRKEIAALNTFVEVHSHSNIFIVSDAPGGGIGTRILIFCDQCQLEGDISDYESW